MQAIVHAKYHRLQQNLTFKNDNGKVLNLKTSAYGDDNGTFIIFEAYVSLQERRRIVPRLKNVCALNEKAKSGTK